MASAGMIYRNYNSTDTTSQGLAISELPQPPASWEREGYFFKEWNTSRDGSGTSLQPGDGIPVSGEAYAIWYGDYIEAVKDSSGIEHPIKDIISNYITSANVPIVVVEGEIDNNGLTLPNNTFSDIYNLVSSGKTIIIRNSIPGYGIYQYLLLSTATYYQNTYALSVIMLGDDGSGNTTKAEFVATSTSGSVHPVFTPTVTPLQGKLTFDGTYNASTNKAATVSTVTNAINALDGGTIGTGSTTKTITSLSQSNGNVSATFSDIAFPVTSVNGQTGAVTTAEKFVITATAISGTEYYNLDKTFADINVAIGDNKYVTIEDIDMTYPYTTTVSQGVVFGATLIATGEGNQLMAVTDGILVVQPDSGTNAMGIAVHSTNVLPTMSDIPSASSTTPLMDGTADVGIQTYIYARADHVHPTDTSRQAVLVSGTNIKTINNESILGSGNISISAGSGQTTFYGTSSSANNAATKVATISGYSLTTGAVVYITFTNNGISQNNMALNVSNTGAKQIRYNGLATTNVSGGQNSLNWDAGDIIQFVYDGSYYQYIGKTSSDTMGDIDIIKYGATDAETSIKINNSWYSNKSLIAVKGAGRTANLCSADGTYFKFATVNAGGNVEIWTLDFVNETWSTTTVYGTKIRRWTDVS